MKRIVTILLAVVVAATARGEPPRAVIDGRGAIGVSLPVSLLHNREVRKQIMSGLTTTFVLQVDGSSSRPRAEVRYEPWDEVFYVGTAGFDGTEERKTLTSEKELERWWSATRLTPFHPAPGTAAVKIIVEVIPFSAREEADAKRWLARSASGSAPAPASGESSVGAKSLISAVVSTSIRRKPMIRFIWSVRPERR